MLRLTRAQVRDIDRLAVEHYKIPGIVLMENAARAATDVALSMLPPHPGKILILAGGGNNGGDGLAVARHLHLRGLDVQIFLTSDPTKYRGDALINWQIVQALNLPVQSIAEIELTDSSVGLHLFTPSPPSLIIDAIFGTGLTAPPRPPFADIVAAVNALHCPVLSIDLPSGMDCDTGQPLGACIIATQTITFVAEKIGFAQPAAAPYLGKVTVGAIGCPTHI
jgi:NAD(P)H-hydrate epimerase